ncbi:MAG: PAS domain S-box protein [Desulfococcaceae bacterium]
MRKLHYFLGISLLMTAVFIIAFSYMTAKELVHSAVNATTDTAGDIAKVLQIKTLHANMDHLISDAKAISFQISAELERAMSAAQNLAEVLSGLKTEEVALGRDAVNTMLFTMLKKNEKLTGVYTCWEPDAFDMPDMDYAGAKGNDSRGRFIPYWYRKKDGQISLMQTQNYENTEVQVSNIRKGEFYLNVRENGIPYITPPFFRKVGDEELSVISMIAPVMVNGKFCGAVGTDIQTDLLQSLVEEAAVKLFVWEGKIMLITHEGIMAAASGMPEMVGKQLRMTPDEWEEEKEHTVSGITISRVEKGKMYVCTPLNMRYFAVPWCLRIEVPETLVRNETDQIYKKMMEDVALLGEHLKRISRKSVRIQICVGVILIISVLLVLILFQSLADKEKDLRQSKSRLQGILDHTSALIYLKDTKGRYVLINRAYEKLFHLASEDIAEKTDYDLFPKNFADAFRGNDQIVTGAGKPMQLEEVAPQEDGNHTYISIKFPLYDSTGKPAGLCGISTDITDRKNAENELRRVRNYLNNIVNSMPSALMGVDNGQRITHWNREAEKTTGIIAEKAQGQLLAKVFPQLSDRMDEIRMTIHEGKSHKAEKIIRRAEGHIRYWDIMIYPLITNGLDGAVIRVDDVTERVRLEEMMVQTEKMMSVGGLAAGMAHEINNPLAGILQSIQNIRRRVSEELPANKEIAEECGTSLETIRSYLEKRKIIRFLDGIQESGQRAAEIVSNMLTFSRRSESVMKPVRLPELISRTVELAAHDYDLKKKYDFRHIRIIREFPADLPEVPCIATEIEQVMLNLLRNAAQAMSENISPGISPQIILRVQKEEKAVRIEVEDNGPGMDKDICKRIFEPFFTTKEVGIGTGLGLSVSYFIITNNHKGSMRAESEPGKGAKFIISLPCLQSRKNAEAETA